MEIAWLMPNSQPEHLLEEQGMPSFLVSNANLWYLYLKLLLDEPKGHAITFY